MSPAALRHQIGQMVIVAFAGRTIPVELRVLAREFGLGGVVLFSENIESPEQIAELSYEAARLDAHLPVWVSVDQEGGRVARLKAPFTEWPPMATLGRSGDAALAERFGRALAEELKAVGITMDYAPVLDVHTNPKNPVIGDRALADKADEVARLGRAVITALQESGVAACGKHFPGHGDTSTDSHLELPLVEHPPDRLFDVEFVPFRMAVEAQVAAIMTAHVLVPALDDQEPATLSKAIVTGLLRDELHYDGLVISDDIEKMKAVTDRHPVPIAAVMAARAGCDAVLMCRTNHHAHAAALEALVHAVEDGSLSRTRVDDACARQRRAKERFLAAGTAVRPATSKALRTALDRLEHRAIADEMARFV